MWHDLNQKSSFLLLWLLGHLWEVKPWFPPVLSPHPSSDFPTKARNNHNKNISYPLCADSFEIIFAYIFLNQEPSNPENWIAVIIILILQIKKKKEQRDISN